MPPVGREECHVADQSNDAGVNGLGRRELSEFFCKCSAHVLKGLLVRLEHFVVG